MGRSPLRGDRNPTSNTPRMSTQWIALLQDVTAVADTTLSADLAAALESVGLAEPTFDEQHLVALFRSQLEPEELEGSLKTVVRECCGLRARFALLTVAGLRSAIAANPFPTESQDDPNITYILFLKDLPPEPVAEKLDSLKAANEKWSLSGKALYIVVPEGFTHSRLALEAQSEIGVGAVVRTWAEMEEVLRILD